MAQEQSWSPLEISTMMEDGITSESARKTECKSSHILMAFVQRIKALSLHINVQGDRAFFLCTDELHCILIVTS